MARGFSPCFVANWSQQTASRAERDISLCVGSQKNGGGIDHGSIHPDRISTRHATDVRHPDLDESGHLARRAHDTETIGQDGHRSTLENVAWVTLERAAQS